ncbi:MOB kinase activator 2-like isoform X2 [Styela clava]|uniref:MOB kinase activator 2-like isoform X1 n=1 Tax=Styela clava TaxID=7725 RepID=UPI00193A48A4|nr:MOB kinase activator 2-like isoform X1 [Styela clava]
MTMLDQILQILSPQNDKMKKSPFNNNNVKKAKRKGKKQEKKPVVKEEHPPYLDQTLIQPTPHDISLHQVVHLPPQIDQKEWVATQVISLFHNINLEYGTMSEFCTAESCPTMQGAGQMQYWWTDDRGKKLKCTAPQYIDYVMTYCQKCVSNEKLFPTKYAHNFVPTFYTDISKMMRFLFHVLSHMYSSHFSKLQQFGLHGHLNIIFMHFILLVREFDLLDAKEHAPLDDLIDLMEILKTKCTDACTRNHHRTSSSTNSKSASGTTSSSGSGTPTSYNTFSSSQYVSSYNSRNNGMAASNSKGWIAS